MKLPFALPTLLFTAGVFGLTVSATADAAAEDLSATPEPALAPSPDNPAGFLGVAVAESPPPPDAGQDLPATVLLVSHVMPASAAEVAGLRSGDLLLQIDDQHLLHPAQLSRLVGMSAAGSEVQLTVFRDGETLTLPATLGERPASLAPAATPLPDAPEGFAPQPMLRPLDLQDMQQHMDRQFEQMRQMFRQGMNEGWPGGEMWEHADPIELDFNLGQRPGGLGQHVTILQDRDHKLTITQNQDGRHLLATDHAGNILYDGPIDNPAQLDAVPAELRDKLPEPGEAGRLNRSLLQPFAPQDWLDRLNPRAVPPSDNDAPGEQLPAPTGRAV